MAARASLDITKDENITVTDQPTLVLEENGRAVFRSVEQLETGGLRFSLEGPQPYADAQPMRGRKWSERTTYARRDPIYRGPLWLVAAPGTEIRVRVVEARQQGGAGAGAGNGND